MLHHKDLLEREGQTINKLSQKREFVFLVAKPKGKREVNVEL